MTPLSDSEAATVARFENTEPAPESWSGGLRRAVRLALAQWSVVPLTHIGYIADALLPIITVWAEQRARERAAEELDVATRWLMRTTDEHENGDWVTWDWRAKAADLLRALAADDGMGQQ